jgi:hypothetical protein
MVAYNHHTDGMKKQYRNMNLENLARVPANNFLKIKTQPLFFEKKMFIQYSSFRCKKNKVKKIMEV